jgi:hypothetical protein
MLHLLAQDSTTIMLPFSYLLTALGALCTVIVTLFWIREKERDRWFDRIEKATAAIEGLNGAVEQLTAEVASLKGELRSWKEDR